MTNSFRKTRYAEIGYRNDGEPTSPSWRFVEASNGNSIGTPYRTEKELLGDLYRYACEFGCGLAVSDAANVRKAMADVVGALEANADAPIHFKIREAIDAAQVVLQELP